MTDPHDALLSFQKVFPLRILKLQKGDLDPKLWVHQDEPAPGTLRLSYVYTEGKIVTAFANFVNVEPVEGRPCFMIGYAVPPQFRGQGRAKAIVKAALAELRNGFGRAGILPLYIEAVVGEANTPSQKVAEGLLSRSPRSITDEVSGQPAFQYLLKMEA